MLKNTTLFSGAISYGEFNGAEAYLEPIQTPLKEHFCKTN